MVGQEWLHALSIPFRTRMLSYVSLTVLVIELSFRDFFFFYEAPLFIQDFISVA